MSFSNPPASVNVYLRFEHVLKMGLQRVTLPVTDGVSRISRPASKVRAGEVS